MPEQSKGPDRQGQKAGVLKRTLSLIPGIVLCGIITIISLSIQNAEEHVFEHPYVEALVIAILLGMAVRTAWQPPERWRGHRVQRQAIA